MLAKGFVFAENQGAQETSGKSLMVPNKNERGTLGSDLFFQALKNWFSGRLEPTYSSCFSDLVLGKSELTSR